MNENKNALAIHGGAGTIAHGSMSAESEQEYRAALETALRRGWEILRKNGGALDAVAAAVVALEDCPLFNAGRGAVFNHDGANEMDACIMDGETQNSGAVAFVRNIKNPILLARAVMEKSEHILLAGSGANEFAESSNIEFAPDEYFFTDLRYEQLTQALKENTIQLDHAADKTSDSKKIENRKSLGTVGAVARDANGNVAAATSTGGMTNKRFGRIGDTPIVGAGTYADNKTCAVSCTGHGEFFMRAVAAYDVAALMKYKNLSLETAAREVVEKLRCVGGEGGLIAVDALGNISMPFNSEGMYRGFINSVRGCVTEIYK